MTAVGPPLALGGHQPNIGFVNQRSGLECMPIMLVSHFHCRQFPQLLIDKRQQFFRSLAVAFVNPLQDLRDIAHATESNRPTAFGEAQEFWTAVATCPAVAQRRPSRRAERWPACQGGWLF